jgi:methylglyoxal synthase
MVIVMAGKKTFHSAQGDKLHPLRTDDIIVLAQTDSSALEGYRTVSSSLADAAKGVTNQIKVEGGAEIAALVVKNKIDLCIFLIDDLSANAHEADIQMLLRQCRVHNIPVACNRHSADLMITSELWGTEYNPTKPLYSNYEKN